MAKNDLLVVDFYFSGQYVDEDKIYKIRPGKENGLSIVVDQHTESVRLAINIKILITNGLFFSCAW